MKGTGTVTATVVDEAVEEADQQLYKSRMLIDQAERQIFADSNPGADVALSGEFNEY